MAKHSAGQNKKKSTGAVRETQLVFFACRQDRESLIKRLIVQELTGDSHMDFSVEPLLTNLAEFSTVTIFCDIFRQPGGIAEGKVQRSLPSADGFIILNGHHLDCASCRDLIELVNDHRIKEDKVLIIVHCGGDYRSMRESDTVRDVREKAPLFRSDNLEDNLALARAELSGCVQEARDVRKRRPQVGVGVFLVRGDEILLTQKLGPPGTGSIATLGGALPHRSEIWSALREIAREDLDLPQNSFRIGHLLSCSNLLVDGRHWLDMTFLGIAGRRCNPRITEEALKNRRSYLPGNQNKIWFSITEAMDLADQSAPALFEPIRNALRGFLHLAVAQRSASEVFTRLSTEGNRISGQPGRRLWTANVSEYALNYELLLPSVGLRELLGYLRRIEERDNPEISPHVFESMATKRGVKA